MKWYFFIKQSAENLASVSLKDLKILDKKEEVRKLKKIIRIWKWYLQESGKTQQRPAQDLRDASEHSVVPSTVHPNFFRNDRHEIAVKMPVLTKGSEKMLRCVK